MHIEQRLDTCGLCRRVLALQYEWFAERVPSWSRDRVMCRSFRCPACGYDNPFLTLMSALRFELKVVPGPEPWVPFPASDPAAGPLYRQRSAGSALAQVPDYSLLRVIATYRWLEMLLA